MTLRGFLKENC